MLETIKSDVHIPRLIENGLLKSIDDIPEINECAKIILEHNVCDDRCKMRIGPGNSEKDFKCRKLHPVKDSPDPTKYCYVPIKYQFQKTTLDILEELGIFIPIINNNNSLTSEHFNHPYFNPK